MNLKTIVTMKKYAGKTVKECIDKHYYAFNILIGYHPEWYENEVFDYLDECNTGILQGRNKILNHQYKKVLQRENT